jgi:hypothetical protein
LSSPESAPPRVGLLTEDLMVRSRVEVALRPRAVRVELLTLGALPIGYDLLLVDLNRDPTVRLAWLKPALGASPVAEAICFGPHTEMARLHPLAMETGARRCVANSHLPDTLGRWLRSRREGVQSPRRGEV